MYWQSFTFIETEQQSEQSEPLEPSEASEIEEFPPIGDDDVHRFRGHFKHFQEEDPPPGFNDTNVIDTYTILCFIHILLCHSLYQHLLLSLHNHTTTTILISGSITERRKCTDTTSLVSFKTITPDRAWKKCTIQGIA